MTIEIDERESLAVFNSLILLAKSQNTNVSTMKFLLELSRKFEVNGKDTDDKRVDK